MFLDLRVRDNEFWDSVRRYYLDDLLASAYRTPWKKRLLSRRLRGRRLAIEIVQKDAESDPLLIELSADAFTAGRADGPAQVRIRATHSSLVGSTRLDILIGNWLLRNISFPELWRRPADHLLCAVIFYF